MFLFLSLKVLPLMKPSENHNGFIYYTKYKVKVTETLTLL